MSTCRLSFHQVTPLPKSSKSSKQFQLLDDLGNGVTWWKLNLHVDMVLVGVDGVKVPIWVSFLDSVETLDQFYFDIGFEDLSSVLSSKNNVVLNLIDTVI